MYWDIIHEQNRRARNPQLRYEKVSKRPTMRKPSYNPKTAPTKPNLRKAMAITSVSLVAALAITGISAANSPDTGENPAESSNLSLVATQLFSQYHPFHENADNLQFSQTGEYWKILGYWNSNVGYTGCGLCSYTTAIDIVTASDYTPLDMLSLRGDWAGMDNYIDDYTGLGDRTHGQFTYDMFKVSSQHVDLDPQSLAQALQDNSVAVICTGGDVFYDVYGNSYDYDGHFVCAYRYDPNTRTFHVHDSAIEHELGTNVCYTWEQMENMLASSTSIVAYKAV